MFRGRPLIIEENFPRRSPIIFEPLQRVPMFFRGLFTDDDQTHFRHSQSFIDLMKTLSALFLITYLQYVFIILTPWQWNMRRDILCLKQGPYTKRAQIRQWKMRPIPVRACHHQVLRWALQIWNVGRNTR